MSFFSNMRGCLFFFYRCGILGHQDRECQKIKKGCLSSNKDELQSIYGFAP